MQIPFCGGSYQGRSNDWNASRAINFFFEPPSSSDDKSLGAMIGTPGTVTYSTYPYGPIRMSYTFVDRCFVVAADTLYEQYVDGTISNPLGSFPNSIGRISVADNGIAANGAGGNQLMMITDGNGYIYDIFTGSFTKIIDPNFPDDAESVCFIDGYFIVTNGSQKAFSSEHGSANGGLVWPALAVMVADSTSDGIQRAYNLHQQLLLIKKNVAEIWQLSGTDVTQGAPYSRIPGAILDYGTTASWSVARGNNSVFFLSNTRTDDSGSFAGVITMDGYSPAIISTPAINYRISKFSTISDAWGYCYTDEGHIFYVLTFPTEDVTFVYDVLSKMWHERSSYIENEKYTEHRHLADTYTYFAGKHLVGHCSKPKLMQMSSDFYTDDNFSIVSIRTSQPLFEKTELSNMKVTKLLVDMESAVGTQDFDSDKAPMAWLAWSNDGGNTWSADYPCSMGKAGEFGKRLVWRRLGSPRNRTFRLKIVAPVKKVVLGAYINNGAMPT